MAQMIIIENEHDAKVVKEALEQWCKHVKNNPDGQYDLDGVLRSLSSDLQPVEEIISELEHASDQSVEEVAYSGMTRELSEEQIVDFVVNKIGAEYVLAQMSNEDIEEYYKTNLVPVVPEETPTEE